MSWPWPLPPAEFAARRTRVAAALGDGVLVATWLAVPVPSAQFDAFLEGEAGAFRVVARAS